MCSIVAKLQAIIRRLRNETSINYEGHTSTDVSAGRGGQEEHNACVGHHFTSDIKGAIRNGTVL